MILDEIDGILLWHAFCSHIGFIEADSIQGTFKLADQGRAGGDNGRIWIYDYATPDLAVSNTLRPLVMTDYRSLHDLHPLGIDFDATTSTLYIINHSREYGSVIELFQVSVVDAVAKYVRTLKHPLIHSPNSLQVLGNGELLVTNDHYLRAAISPLLSQIETFAGAPGGSVVYTNIHDLSQTKVLARVPFANGLTTLNSTTVAVASSSKPGVYLYTLKDDRSLAFQKFVRTPAGADNLSKDSDGKLLIAGHPFAPALMKLSKHRAYCNLEGNQEERAACECTAPSWAAEWSEEGGLKELYKNSGDEFCSSSTLVRDVRRGISMISGLYDKGILVLKA